MNKYSIVSGGSFSPVSPADPVEAIGASLHLIDYRRLDPIMGSIVRKSFRRHKPPTSTRTTHRDYNVRTAGRFEGSLLLLCYGTVGEFAEDRQAEMIPVANLDQHEDPSAKQNHFQHRHQP